MTNANRMLRKLGFRWKILMFNWGMRELGRRPRVWIWAGHLGISASPIPRFRTRLMVKKGKSRGIRVSQFGPLVLTWEETL